MTSGRSFPRQAGKQEARVVLKRAVGKGTHPIEDGFGDLPERRERRRLAHDALDAFITQELLVAPRFGDAIGQQEEDVARVQAERLGRVRGVPLDAQG